MYTATKLGESTNQQMQRRIVTVRFDNGGGHIFERDFSFGLSTSSETIKKTVKEYLDEINLVIPVVTDFNPAPDTVPPAPTPTELDRAAWTKKRDQPSTLMLLVRDGVFTGNETQVTNLQTEVRTGFKAAYLN